MKEGPDGSKYLKLSNEEKLEAFEKKIADLEKISKDYDNPLINLGSKISNHFITARI